MKREKEKQQKKGSCFPEEFMKEKEEILLGKDPNPQIELDIKYHLK